MGRETYRGAGVDIDLVEEAIRALTGKVTFRRKGPYGMLGGVGHYAGLIGFGDHVLALTTDGVGTKMLVADALSDWRTVGIDCIAMNANDLFVMNLEPVAFVDYIATDRLSVEKMAQIGVGLNEGARLANLNLVGGETAQLPGLVKGLDLAGACLGVQERGKVVTGEQILPGDCILGVPSSGIHSNGLSLARRVVEKAGGYGERLPDGTPLGRALLTPTRIYLEALEACRRAEIHGMCHVTGSGLLNFPRLTKYGFDITDPLPVPPVFTWLQEKGEIDTAEMYRTFNMGMGFAYVLTEDQAGIVRKLIPGSRVVGTVTEEPGIRLRGLPVG